MPQMRTNGTTMKVRIIGRDGGTVIFFINARDLDKHKARHPSLEVITTDA